MVFLDEGEQVNLWSVKLFNLLACLVPVHYWHAEVEQDEVDLHLISGLSNEFKGIVSVLSRMQDLGS